MDWDSTSRAVTVEENRLPFLHRGYLHPASGKVLWQASYLYSEFKKMNDKRKLNKFIGQWRRRLLSAFPFLDPNVDVIFKPPDAEDMTKIPKHLLSTIGIIMLIFTTVCTQQSPAPYKTACLVWLEAIWQCVIPVVQCLPQGLLIVPCGVFSLTFSINGVGGWESVIERVNEACRREWHRFRCSLGPVQVTLGDILKFLAVSRLGSMVSPRARELLDTVAHALLGRVAVLFENYVFDHYGASHDLDAAPRVLRSNQNRVMGGVDATTAWAALERSRQVFRASPSTVVEVKSDESTFRGMVASNGSTWAAKEMAMYQDGNRDIMRRSTKFMVAADPSGYAGQNTLVGLVWSWEQRLAAYGPVQILPASHLILPSEIYLSDTVKELMRRRGLERVAAYREWQGISALVKQTTSYGLDDFAIPDKVCLRRVEDSEVRVVDTSDPNHFTAYIVNRDTQETTELLPDGVDPGSFRQLTIQLDSGSIGRAGACFVKNSGKLLLFLFVLYDKIHRLIRDIKLAADKACGGDLYRALLHYSFLCSLNQRPFGSGSWFELKKELLAHFLQTCDSVSPLFRKFAELIAEDAGMVLETEADYEVLWNRLPDLLRSFVEKGAVPKLMRWFSVNGLFEERKTEFWGLKMLLQHHLGDSDPDDADALIGMQDPAQVMQQNPREELRQLRASHGGLQLAEKLITPWLRQHIRQYCCGTKASWSWYTHQVETVRTPKDGLNYFCQVANGGWQKEIADLLQQSLDTPATLAEMGLDWSKADANQEEHGIIAGKQFDFTGRLTANRCWSNAVYDAPPFSYVDVLTNRVEAQRRGMMRMQQDAAMLWALEAMRFTTPAAATLLDAIQELVPPAIRLLYLTFERDGWKAESRAGRRILNTMLLILPDQKCVEDTHQHLRDLQRQGRSLISSHVSRFRACYDSGVLEQRGIPHKMVSKSTFVRNFKKRVKLGDRFSPRKHKLAKAWSGIIDRRFWSSPTPEAFRSNLAAWHWCQQWFGTPDPRPCLGNAWMSALTPELGVLQDGDHAPSLCLGNAKWGALTLNLIDMHVDTEERPHKLWRLGRTVSWVHVIDVAAWQVVPADVLAPLQARVAYPGVVVPTIYLRQRAQPVSLLRYALSEKISMPFDQIKALAHLLGLSTRGLTSRLQVLLLLGRHITKDDCEAEATAFQQRIEENEKKPSRKKGGCRSINRSSIRKFAC